MVVAMLGCAVILIGMVWEIWREHEYKNVLDENIFQSSKKLQLGSGMVFQHDDDPKHIAHSV